MKYQQLSGYCGITAINNALRCLGKKVPEKSIACHISTDIEKHGTNETELKTAIEGVGYTWVEISTNKQEEALLQLDASFPSILCIDGWSHWVTVIGKVGGRYIVVDPSRTKANLVENGVHVMAPKELVRRWKCWSEPKPYYGLQIFRKDNI